MRNLEIISNDEFKKDFEWYGYEELVRKVLHNCANKKEFGLVGKITLIDAEPSKRIFFQNEMNKDFTVRYFIAVQNEKMWIASYTLYINVSDGDGTGHGEEISSGYVTTHYVYNDDNI